MTKFHVGCGFPACGQSGIEVTQLPGSVDELQAKARDVNRRLLDTERVGQGCVLASPAFERIARPTLTGDGRRAPALRFGVPRVRALAGALCTTLLAVTGITNKSLPAS